MGRIKKQDLFDEEDGREDGSDDEGEERGPIERVSGGRWGGVQLPIVEEPPKGWLTRAAAAHRIGCHANRIAQMEKRGELTAVKLKETGQVFYEPSSVEELAAEEKEMRAADLLRASQQIIKTQMEHLENVMKMATASAAQLLELQGKVVTDLRERNKLLEEQMNGVKEQISDAESKNFDRELALRQFEGEEARKDASEIRANQLASSALATLKTFAPAIMVPLAKKIGGDPAAIAALDPVLRELASSVTEEQARALFGAGIFDQAQLVRLNLVLKTVREVSPGPEEAKVVDEPKPLS